MKFSTTSSTKDMRRCYTIHLTAYRRPELVVDGQRDRIFKTFLRASEVTLYRSWQLGRLPVSGVDGVYSVFKGKSVYQMGGG